MSDRADVLSQWTDRPMLVGGFEFAAGQVTIVDVLDHAARAFTQKQEQRAAAARKHEWNKGRPGYGVQCVHCGTGQWVGLSSRGVVSGNLEEECPRRPEPKEWR